VLNKGQRLGFLVVLAVQAWAARADATVTLVPASPLDVGNVLVGQTAMASADMTIEANDRVDLVIGTCTGTGTGTFAFTNATDLNANPTVGITVSYTPTTRGPRSCTVNVYPTGTTMNSHGTFTISGNGQAPATFTPTPAPTTTFGQIRWNDAAPVHTFSRNFNIQNNGDQTLVISDVTITGTNAADWTMTAGMTSDTITGGNAKTWTFQFDPATAGAKTATITFTSNAAGSPHSFNISGTGTNAVISVDGTPNPANNDVVFGTVAVGSTASADVSITNVGAATKGNLGVTVATIAITSGTGVPGAPSWFSITGCGTSQSCTLSPALSILNLAAVVGVRCSPPGTALDTHFQNATLTLTTDSDDQTDRVLNLSCVAGVSQLTPSESMIDFTPTLVTTSATPKTFTVTNSSMTLSNSFYVQLTGAGAGNFGASVVGQTCGTSAANQCTLAPQGSLTIQVTFTPGTEAQLSAGLSIFNTGALTQLSLGGKGIDRHISVEPSMSFPDTFRNPGDKATVLPVTVTNTGEYPLSVTQLQIGPDPIWALADQPDPFMVPGLGTYNVNVKFSPDMAGKVADGALTLYSDDRVTGMTSVALVGNGKDRNVQMGPTVIELGDTGAGVPTRLSDVKMGQLLSVENLDNVNDFRVREIKILGDDVFNLDAKSDGELLPLGASKYDVIFVPPHVGEFSATAQLFLDMDPIPQTSVEIRGRALFVDAHGSGGFGCSTGQGTGGGMLLVLGALLLRRRRRAATVLAGVLAVPAAVRAEPTRNINLNVFDPTPATSASLFQLQAADVGASGDYAATALASFASGALVLDTITTENDIVGQQTMIALGGAYAFADKLEAGARIPLFMQSGDPVPPGMFGVPPAKGTALGDLTLHGKMRLRKSATLVLGAGLALTLPTASDSQFSGTDLPIGRVLGLGTYTASRRLTFHVNLGAVLRKRIQFANIEQGTGPTLGAGVAFRAFDKLFFNLEAFGDIVPSGYHAEPAPGETMGAASTLATIEALAGARLLVTRQLVLGLAAGRGLTSGIGTPAVRGVFTLAYTPGAKELPTLHRPVVDRPVDLSKYDSDGDQVADSVDKCVDVKEDWDKFEDDDGCPEDDNDKDGVKDSADKCLLVAEDLDKFEDRDGCPEDDNDRDGIVDAKDRCPSEAEKINGNSDDDGCPDTGDSLVISNPERLELMESVAFTGPAISEGNTVLLEQLAATLRARADIVRLRITVHVQPTKSPEKDQALTEQRARAVKDWLVQWGIAASRIEVKGFGGSKPLVPANQKGAAAVNDRVELIILERNIIKK
jgi:MYXO-CTERM domain-containing protein